MAKEIVLNPDSKDENIICLNDNETKYVFERGNETPRLVIYARSNIGVDIEADNQIYHLPCFLLNSDHLLHAIKFQLRDKSVLIRTF